MDCPPLRDRHGWFEPQRARRRGRSHGLAYDLERLDVAEEPLCFAEPGIVIAHRVHTMSEVGDCLIQVAEPIAA